MLLTRFSLSLASVSTMLWRTLTVPLTLITASSFFFSAIRTRFNTIPIIYR